MDRGDSGLVSVDIGRDSTSPSTVISWWVYVKDMYL